MRNESVPVKVSVLMLAYNHERFVTQALESVLAQQTGFRFEILVGDDASTDATASIIKDYARRYPDRIIPILNEKNVGATENLYHLIENARGEYLAYLECDDYWSDDQKLEKQIDFLEKNPEYIGCTHTVSTVDENGIAVGEPVSWISGKTVYRLEDFDGITLAGHINSMVHRNIYKTAQGEYKDLITLHPLISDRSICVLLIAHGPIYRINEAMSCYRVPKAGGSNATSILFIDNSRKVLDDYEFTKKLQKYASEKLQITLNFEPHKEELLFSAVWMFIRRPGKESREIAWEMLRNMHSGKDLCSLFRNFIRKINERLKRG